MASHDIIAIIKSSPLSEEQKAAFVKNVQENGLTPGVLEALKDVLRGKEIESLNSMGLRQTATPALAKAHADFKSEVTSATEDFASGMADIQKKVDATLKSVAKDTEKAQAAVTTAAMAS